MDQAPRLAMVMNRGVARAAGFDPDARKEVMGPYGAYEWKAEFL
ncbi:hypothetical protein JM93_03042 [Roseibium hamelinense]|uniref:Uncharacterized protein n=1 Tax=Roseibium hamelinense TaxID=150831 RepID=A0A562SUH2_9HYPH|nr:hypothetical protein JM93_03042 [Roseibium hamelinense]